HTPDAGEIKIAGHPVPTPIAGGRAHALGLRFVHQDLGLIPSLTVIENLLLADIASAAGVYIAWKRERVAARRLVDRYRLDVDCDADVADLSPVQRAMLAILRAVRDLIFDGEYAETLGSTSDEATAVLVLDEPTVFLSGRERSILFTMIKELAGA